MGKNVFQKSKLAVAIAIAAGSVALTGCDGYESKTITEDASRIEITEAKKLSAEVHGIVQDTNGNPIAGARVSIGGIATSTDSRGAYVLRKVPVTAIGQDGDLEANELMVSIVPSSSKYLAATVSVTPSATTIITGVNGEGDTTANEEDSLLSVILVDGMAVSAGLTVVPALTASLEGVLRDSETGLVIPDTVVALELIEVNSVNQQQEQNDDNSTGYSAMPYQAATDANGYFVFENLPEDTDFDIVVAGYQSGVSFQGDGNLGNPDDGEIATTPEVAMQNIGDVLVSAITSNDNVDPFVASVNGVVSQSAGTGMLNDDLDGTQGIVINFNEPLVVDKVDTNSVYVINKTLNEVIDLASIAISADGMMLTITTTAAIAPGTSFEVNLNVVDFEDGAENNLEAGPGSFLNEPTPGFDSDVAASATLPAFVRLSLKTYKEPVLNPGAPTLAVVAEDAAENDHPVLRQLNASLSDVDYEDNGLQQLNSNDNDDGVGGSDTAERLLELATATSADSGLDSAPPAVQVDHARVNLVVTDAMVYRVELADADGDAKTVTIDAIDDVTIGGTATQATLTLDADFSDADFDMILSGVEPNDVLTVTPLNDFDLPVTASVASVALTDVVAPTTIVQNSYGQGLDTAGVSMGAYGDGGELSSVEGGATGAPFLNITPKLLVPQAGNAIPLPVSSIWKALAAGNTVDVNDDDVVDTSLAGYQGYDAAAIAAWTLGSRTMAIAFSEDIAPVAPAATVTPVTAATGLSGWAIQNDVLKNDANGAVNGDLINVDVADVIALANTDDGESIDFTGQVQDESGNVAVAANNAKVVVRDLMPPMPLTAVYSGDSITVTYNENVTLEANDDTAPETMPTAAADTFKLQGTVSSSTITVTQEQADANVNTSTVTLDLTETKTVIGATPAATTTMAYELNKAAVFNRGTYDHDSNSSTDDAAHALLVADTVRDVNNGTSWYNWDGNTASVIKPVIVIRDETGDFSATAPTVSSGFAAAGTSFSATYKFSHRVDLEASGFTATAGANALTGAEVAAAFSITGTGTGVIDAAASSATLSPDGKTLTVTVGLSVALAAGDILSTALTADSAWDSSAAPVAIADTAAAI